MKRWNQYCPWIYWIGRLLLAAVFIYAAILKMKSPQDFADSMAAYQILPEPVINIAALGVPLFEFACGLLVLSGFHIRVGALGILAMLILFIAALVVAWFRGLSIDCGCFGSHSWLEVNPRLAFLRDLVLLVVAVVVYRNGKVNSTVAQRS